jgi:hypothetical protein
LFEAWGVAEFGGEEFFDDGVSSFAVEDNLISLFIPKYDRHPLPIRVKLQDIQ